MYTVCIPIQQVKLSCYHTCTHVKYILFWVTYVVSCVIFDSHNVLGLSDYYDTYVVLTIALDYSSNC